MWGGPPHDIRKTRCSYDPRADKITVAITEAIIASQRDDEHPSFAYVETDTTLKALAVVAARIAFETKIADTAVLHAGERMFVAALPERFESVADHLGMLLGERSALGAS